MREIKAPQPFERRRGETSVFLAGSIEMGTAVDWQKAVCAKLHDLPVAILNPRRSDWDSSWAQSIDNPQFRQQVDWELDMLERAGSIFMYFDPATKSPISLLELGLFAKSERLIVCCPQGYWRKGNVEIVCNRYNVPLYVSLEQAIRCLIREVSPL